MRTRMIWFAFFVVVIDAMGIGLLMPVLPDILEELIEQGLHVYLLKYYKFDRKMKYIDENPVGWDYSKSKILAIGILDHEPEYGVTFTLDIGTKILMVTKQISANLDYVFEDFDVCFMGVIPIYRS